MKNFSDQQDDNSTPASNDRLRPSSHTPGAVHPLRQNTPPSRGSSSLSANSVMTRNDLFSGHSGLPELQRMDASRVLHEDIKEISRSPEFVDQRSKTVQSALKNQADSNSQAQQLTAAASKEIHSGRAVPEPDRRQIEATLTNVHSGHQTEATDRSSDRQQEFAVLTQANFNLQMQHLTAAQSKDLEAGKAAFTPNRSSKLIIKFCRWSRPRLRATQLSWSWGI